MMDLLHPVTGKVLFSRTELASSDTGEMKLATGFDNLLIELRLAFGSPMVVNSCCRTRAHNTKVGGNPRSLHMMDNPVHPIDGTAAIDISAKSGGGHQAGAGEGRLELGVERWNIENLYPSGPP